MVYIYENGYKISKSTFKNVTLYYFFQSKINFFFFAYYVYKPFFE